ncbi:MAG: hypothetical protein LAQ69_40715 [Acidobacteriia bacterium]|nr:hypothetical protein [Terriglobia bacterium]
MKNRLLTFAGGLALLAVLGKFYAVPAIAQAVRAALVKNIDERGRIPFQARFSCSDVAQCSALANPVPAHSRLVIEHIGAQCLMTTGDQISQLILTNDTGTQPDFLIATFQARFAVAGRDVYVTSQPVLAYVEAGQRPTVTLSGGSQATVTINGVISGYLVDLSQ